MADSKPTRKRENPIYLRMPDDLVAVARAQAAANTRSLNGELIHRLRESYGLPPPPAKVNPRKLSSD